MTAIMAEATPPPWENSGNQAFSSMQAGKLDIVDYQAGKSSIHDTQRSNERRHVFKIHETADQRR